MLKAKSVDVVRKAVLQPDNFIEIRSRLFELSCSYKTNKQTNASGHITLRAGATRVNECVVKNYRRRIGSWPRGRESSRPDRAGCRAARRPGTDRSAGRSTVGRRIAARPPSSR